MIYLAKFKLKLIKSIKLIKSKILKVYKYFFKFRTSCVSDNKAKLCTSTSMLKSKIESLLFVSPKPISARQLSNLGIGSVGEIEKYLQDLKKEYFEEKRGIQIIEHDNKYQMVSAKENFQFIQKLTKQEVSGELSRPSLETLTIIAYRAPISKLDIERIRGINCTLILRNLLMRGLIELKFDTQKSENYYNISFDFMRYLGINKISELPNYEKLSKHDSIERMLNEQ